MTLQSRRKGVHYL